MHLYFQCVVSELISHKITITGGIGFRLFSSLCFNLLSFCLRHSTLCKFRSFWYRRGLVQQGRIVQLKLKSINQSWVHVCQLLQFGLDSSWEGLRWWREAGERSGRIRFKVYRCRMIQWQACGCSATRSHFVECVQWSLLSFRTQKLWGLW
jgi:hypothetical protein